MVNNVTVWPTVIFQGQRKRISKTERDGCDSRVCIMFQEKALCDEAIIMKECLASEWANSLYSQILVNRKDFGGRLF